MILKLAMAIFSLHVMQAEDLPRQQQLPPFNAPEQTTLILDNTHAITMPNIFRIEEDQVLCVFRCHK